MGRKSLARVRKSDPAKTRVWLELLIPQLQTMDLQALTMDDLATMMGKSKSTIYEYFPTKEVLLLEAVRIRLKALEALREGIDFTQGDIKTLYLHYITLISQVVADISISFLDAIENGFPNIWKEILTTIQKIIDDLTQLYTIGIERQDFKQVSATWLIAIDRFFVTKLIHDSKLWSDQSMNLEQLIHEYVEIRLNGLLS